MSVAIKKNNFIQKKKFDTHSLLQNTVSDNKEGHLLKRLLHQ